VRDPGRLVGAAVGNEPNTLAGQRRRELREVRREQDRAQIGDIPLAAHVLDDELIGLEAIENADAVIG